uniref:Putative secreted protein n=1 Tax=Amblyomma triste TaxID=251400 RepID=A0A023G3M6_AMBTT
MIHRRIYNLLVVLFFFSSLSDDLDDIIYIYDSRWWHTTMQAASSVRTVSVFSVLNRTHLFLLVDIYCLRASVGYDMKDEEMIK